MQRTYQYALLGTMMSLATPGWSSVTLTNGSFEETGAQYSIAIGGLFEASGWFNASPVPIQASSALPGFEGVSPVGITGSRYLRLASDHPDPQNTGVIYQLLGTMVAGQTYTIRADAFGGDSINRNWGAVIGLSRSNFFPTGAILADSIFVESGKFVKDAFRFSYTARGFDDGAELYIYAVEASSRPGATGRGGIDNIRLAVTGVPEPTNWMMLVAGFGIAGASIRRHRAIASVPRLT